MSARAKTGDGSATRHGVSDVARRAGVTPGAVTLALQDSPMIGMRTKERVFWASRRLGYRRSRVGQRKLLNIAAIVGVADPTENLLLSSNVGIWEGLSRCAEAHDVALHTYVLHLGGAALKFADLPVLLRRDQADGVVLLGIVFPALLAFLRRAGIPVVVASNVELPGPIDQVRIDYIAGARALTQALLERGHREIGFLTAGADLLVNQQMYRGFADVLREQRCFDRRLVFRCKPTHLTGIEPAATLLRRKPAPTAVLAVHWQAACQLAFAANRAGIAFDAGFEIAFCGTPETLDFVYPVLRSDARAHEVGEKALKRLMELHREPARRPLLLTVSCMLQVPAPPRAGRWRHNPA